MPNIAVKMAFAGDASDRACAATMHETASIDSPRGLPATRCKLHKPLSGPSEIILANYASSKFRHCISLVNTPKTTTPVATEDKTETSPVAAAVKWRFRGSTETPFQFNVECRGAAYFGRQAQYVPARVSIETSPNLKKTRTKKLTHRLLQQCTRVCRSSP